MKRWVKAENISEFLLSAIKEITILKQMVEMEEVGIETQIIPLQSMEIKNKRNLYP